MSKFTFFTILFSLIVIVIVGQLILRDALFPEEFQATIINDELDSQSENEPEPTIEDEPDVVVDEEDDPFLAEAEALLESLENEDEPIDEPTKLSPSQKRAAASVGDDRAPAEAPEVKNPIPAPATSSDFSLVGDNTLEVSDTFLSQRRIEQVGFPTVTSKTSQKIFDLFDFGSTNPSSVTSFQVSEAEGPVGVLTEVVFPDEISAQEFYQLLQNKTKVYVDLSINETNSYGDRSFFINHGKKQGEAFLVTRIRKHLYTFAYVKTYHTRIKSLISLLYADILS